MVLVDPNSSLPLTVRRIPGARARMLAASVASAAMLLYGLAGHGLHELTADPGISNAVAGLCFLVVAVLGGVVFSKPRVFRKVVAIGHPPTSESAPEAAPADRRARASPVSLQRFRN